MKCLTLSGVSVCLMLAIIRKRLAVEAALHSTLRIRSVIPFEKIPIQNAFQKDHSEE